MQDGYYFRDHVAGALNRDDIPDPDVEPSDFVLVVQGCAAHDDAGNADRFKFGDRRQYTGPADLDHDRVNPGFFAARGEFHRDGPARAARNLAQFGLQGERIDLDDGAVDFERKRIAHVAEFMESAKDFVTAVDKPDRRRNPEAPAAHPIQKFPL